MTIAGHSEAGRQIDPTGSGDRVLEIHVFECNACCFIPKPVHFSKKGVEVVKASVIEDLHVLAWLDIFQIIDFHIVEREVKAVLTEIKFRIHGEESSLIFPCNALVFNKVQIGTHGFVDFIVHIANKNLPSGGPAFST